MGGPTAILRFFEGVEQVDERREVDAAAVLRRGDARTQREDASMSVKSEFLTPPASGTGDERGIASSTA